MKQEEAFKKVQDIFDECKHGVWIGASSHEIHLLYNFAEASLLQALNGDWESAKRWATRCVEMEKVIGFEHAPIWGDFYETIKRIYTELRESNST